MSGNLPEHRYTVHQFHSGSAFGDAITNYMFEIQEFLQRNGYVSDIFVDNVAPQFQHKLKHISTYKGDQKNLLIVHHSMGFDSFREIISLPDKKILIYHNITPPEFLQTNPTLSYYASLGYQQVKEYKNYIAMALADSEYNRQELYRMGYSKVEVLPITVNFENFENAKVIDDVFRTFKGKVNFLFVGRIVPNKKQEDLVKCFYYYHKYVNKEANLILVGGYDGFEDYKRFIEDLAGKLEIRERVYLAGKVSFDELVTYYKVASVFISMSEHEGFCVPLLEAMYFNIPIIAYNAGAVPGTLGGAGILLSDKNYMEIAELVNQIVKNEGIKQCIIKKQRDRVNNYKKKKIDNKLLQVIRRTQSATFKDIENYSIQIQGAFESSYSLAVVNRSLALALDQIPTVNVSLYPSEGLGDYTPKDEDLIDKPAVKSLWMKSLQNKNPYFVIRNMFPPRVNDSDGKYNFLYFAWEESVINENWVKEFNNHLDGILATSNFVKNVLINSGVKIPIAVISEGIDDVFKKDCPPYRLPTGKSFRFLHISSGFPRKGINVLLKAYFEEFTSNEDVCLVIKTFPNIHNNVQDLITSWKRKSSNPPEVIHINEDLNDEKYHGLYKVTHCFVMPTRGEGFGRPIAEAMMAKIPVIVTGYGGHMDFCGDETAFLLNYKLAPSKSHLSINGSMWAEPDVEDFKKKMRHVFENYNNNEIAERVNNAYNNISKFTWEEVAKKCMIFLNEIKHKSMKVRVGIITTWNSRCGIAEYNRYLLDNIPLSTNIEFFVFANRVNEKVRKDEKNVVRCWNAGYDDNLEGLLHHLLENYIDLVHLHFNYGFYNIINLGNILRIIKGQGIKVLITMHSTINNEISLEAIKDEFKSVDKILVHSDIDITRLRNLGIIDNVDIFPHGNLVFENSDKYYLRSLFKIKRSPIIGIFGFCLPQKGIKESIKAIRMLKDEYPDILLVSVTSLYPNPISDNYYKACIEMIEELHLDKNVVIIPHYLSVEEIITLLQLCDLIVLPYQHTNESVSGAIRFPLASGRPVITTKSSIFNDVKDVVYQIEDGSPLSIAEGIKIVLEDKDLQENLERNVSAKVKSQSWEQVGKFYVSLINNSIKAKKTQENSLFSVQTDSIREK